VEGGSKRSLLLRAPAVAGHVSYLLGVVGEQRRPA
jgi:hypothetical protein